jgi:tetratricopeptide (TPR) repeat protein
MKQIILINYTMTAEEYFDLAHEKYEQGLFQEAIELLDKYIEHNPNAAAAYSNRGICYAELKQYENAITNYNKAITLNPTDADTYGNRGICYSELNMFSKAIKDFNKHLKFFPNSAASMFNRGNANFNIKKFLKALKDFDNAISLEPFNSQIYKSRGATYFYLKEFQLALEDYTKAIELKENDSILYSDRGIVYKNINEYTNAISDFNNVIELDKKNIDAYFSRGQIYVKIKEYAKAINDFNRVIDINPNNYLNVYSERSYAYYLIKSYSDALNDINKSVASNPHNANSYINRGSIYQAIEDDNNAIADYTYAMALDPNNAVAYYNRGTCYTYLKQYNNAIADYNQAIKLDPTFAQAYLYRGNTYSEINEIDLSTIDYISYLYLSIGEDTIKGINRLLESFEYAYPQNILTIAENFGDIPLHWLFHYFEDAATKTRHFSLLLEYYQKAKTFDTHTLLSHKALLHYYLGGNVSAYIIYDEQLDNGTTPLNSQELYYYAKSATDIHIDHQTVIANCIAELTPTSPTDHYYLAQLYYLQGNTEQAIVHFTLSRSFIYSAIMLCYLNDDGSLQSQLSDQIRQYTFPAISHQIDIAATDLSQFATYFHQSECLQAINHLIDTYELPLNVTKEPFWAVFTLTYDAENELYNKIRKIETEETIQKLHETFADALLENIPESADDTIKDLKHRLIECSGYNVKEIVDTLLNDIQKGYRIDNQIGMRIEIWKLKQPKLYLYIIEYFYLIESIDSKQTFTLFLYLLKIFKEKKEEKIKELQEKLIIDFLTELGKSSINKALIKSAVVSMKNSTSMFIALFKDYNAELPEKSDYMAFEEEHWKFIAEEKAMLTEEQFNQKYQMFMWFDNYKF